MEPAAPAPDFSTLPMTAMVCMMRHLPQKERHGSRCCHASVCKAWCAAAAARATFDLEGCSSPHSLTLWLQKYGRLATNIDLRSLTGLSTLPCPLLQRLAVKQSPLSMAAGSQLAVDIMAAKQISSLHLNQVAFDHVPDLASVLTALPNLQDLALRQLQVRRPNDVAIGSDAPDLRWWGPGSLTALPPSEILLLVQQLASAQTLTRLDIQGPMNPGSCQGPGTIQNEPKCGLIVWEDGQCRIIPIGTSVRWRNKKTLQDFEASLQVISSMSSLQHLELNIPEGIDEITLAHLHLRPTLTELHLGGLECSVTLKPPAHHKNGISTAPDWQHLSLCWQAPGYLFCAPALDELSKLQSLKLSSVNLVNNAAGKVELLELLPQLQLLTRLVLDSVQFKSPDVGAGSTGQRGNANGAWERYLAGERDTCVYPDAHLEESHVEQAVLQESLALHATCYAALLTHSSLASLEVVNTRLPWHDTLVPFTRHQAGTQPKSRLNSIYLKADTSSTAVDTSILEGLIKSCSGLQALHVSGAHASTGCAGFGCHSFLPALQHLPHLTRLAVSGVTDVTIWSLAQLTNLQELRILSPSGLHGGGLKALTALQRLTSLDLGMCEFSVLVRAAIIQNGTLRNISGEQTLWRFSSTAPHGTLPDVWLQVQALIEQESCTMSPATAKTLSPAKKSAPKSPTRRQPRSPALTRSPLFEFGMHLFELPATGLSLSDAVARAGSTFQQPDIVQDPTQEKP